MRRKERGGEKTLEQSKWKEERMDYRMQTNTKSVRRGWIVCGTTEMCFLQGSSVGTERLCWRWLPVAWPALPVFPSLQLLSLFTLMIQEQTSSLMLLCLEGFTQCPLWEIWKIHCQVGRKVWEMGHFYTVAHQQTKKKAKTLRTKWIDGETTRAWEQLLNLKMQWWLFYKGLMALKKQNKKKNGYHTKCFFRSGF